MKAVWTLFFILSLSLSSCARKGVRSDGSVEQMGPPAPAQTTTGSEMGPQPAPNQTTGPIEGPVGPQPGPDYVPPKDGYVLVLGPGLARGLAYLGVISELEAKGVKIYGVVGVEIGALIGGIWASSNLNNLEWEMHKFDRKTLLDFGLLNLRDRVAEGKKLYKFLESSIKMNALEKMRIPTLIASSAIGENAVGLLIEKTGSARDIIRGAMGIPGIIKSFSYEGKERITAAVENPFPVTMAQELGIGKTLCVDVIGRGNNFSPKEAAEQSLATLMKTTSVIARDQLKNCDTVLSIPTDGMGYLNFENKAELIYRGKQAVQKWLGQMR